LFLKTWVPSFADVAAGSAKDLGFDWLGSVCVIFGADKKDPFFNPLVSIMIYHRTLNPLVNMVYQANSPTVMG